MKKVAIIQSNYIPWKGYFDIINMVDIFVLHDDLKLTKQDWRNRNKIKVPFGDKTIWLTIPIKGKNKYNRMIMEAEAADNLWRKKHWLYISQYYSKAPFFMTYKKAFEELYLNCSENKLSMINYRFIKLINDILGIKTEILWSHQLKVKGHKSDKVLNLCKALNADVYLSGPAAKNYLKIDDFEQNGIKVQWMDYSGYPEYPQLYTPPFIHEVSIIDLIFNTGNDAYLYMKSFDK